MSYCILAVSRAKDSIRRSIVRVRIGILAQFQPAGNFGILFGERQAHFAQVGSFPFEIIDQDLVVRFHFP